MSLGGLNKRLGRTAPHGDQPAGAARLFEVANVLAQLLGQIHLRLPFFNVWTVDLFDVIVIEYGRTWSDRRQERLELVEKTVVEHSGIRRGFEHVVFEDVPAGKDEVVEPCEWDEFLHLRRTPVGALAQPDGAHLGQRADGFCQAFADRFYPSHKRGGYSAHARDHDTKLAFRGLHGACICHRCLRALTTTTAARGQLHLAAGSFCVGEGSFAMFMLPCGRSGCKLFTVASAIGIPPISHKDSRAFLVHEMRSSLVAVASHRHHTWMVSRPSGNMQANEPRGIGSKLNSDYAEASGRPS